MQTLFIKVTNPDTGESIKKEIKVMRSWQDVNGLHVYLHANGVYGYKDGSPVKSAADLAVIGDPGQHAQAIKWWKLVGQTASEQFYANRDSLNMARSMRGLPSLDAGALDLDSVLYKRRPLKDRRASAYSDPTLWPVFYENGRPDWWGKAGVIEIDDFRYVMLELEEDEDAEDTSEPDPAPQAKETTDADGPDFNPDPGD